ncbi:MAG: inositol monophosphatase family protein [Bacillota bacterium]
MKLKDELNLAIKLSKEAGREILDVYHNKDFNVEYKEDDSPLTEADRRVNQVIVSALRENFKRYAILSEESKDNKDRFENDWCWVLCC